MNKEKLQSMAKTMKWVPMLIGILALFIGGVSLFVKTEDPEVKRGIMLFALLGIVGLTCMVFGIAMSHVFDALAELPSQEEKEDDDLDIMA